MSEQAHADDVLPQNVDVKSIMDTWTLQMGFPVIIVTRNYSTASVSFEQVCPVIPISGASLKRFNLIL